MNTRLKKANLATLICSWYPYADKETIETLTHFVVWIFVVDDKIDEISLPNPAPERAFEKLYWQNLKVVRQSLQLGTGIGETNEVSADLLDSFRPVGNHICLRYTSDKPLQSY